jgi:hypothetical protein
MTHQDTMRGDLQGGAASDRARGNLHALLSGSSGYACFYVWMLAAVVVGFLFGDDVADGWACRERIGLALGTALGCLQPRPSRSDSWSPAAARKMVAAGAVASLGTVAALFPLPGVQELVSVVFSSLACGLGIGYAMRKLSVFWLFSRRELSGVQNAGSFLLATMLCLVLCALPDAACMASVCALPLLGSVLALVDRGHAYGELVEQAEGKVSGSGLRLRYMAVNLLVPAAVGCVLSMAAPMASGTYRCIFLLAAASAASLALFFASQRMAAEGYLEAVIRLAAVLLVCGAPFATVPLQSIGSLGVAALLAGIVAFDEFCGFFGDYLCFLSGKGTFYHNGEFALRWAGFAGGSAAAFAMTSRGASLAIWGTISETSATASLAVTVCCALIAA